MEKKLLYTQEELAEFRKQFEELAKKIQEVEDASIIIISRLPVEGSIDVGYSVVGPLSENLYMLEFVKFQMLFREQVKILGQQQAQKSNIVAPPPGFFNKKGGMTQ